MQYQEKGLKYINDIDGLREQQKVCMQVCTGQYTSLTHAQHCGAITAYNSKLMVGVHKIYIMHPILCDACTYKQTHSLVSGVTWWPCGSAGHGHTLHTGSHTFHIESGPGSPHHRGCHTGAVQEMESYEMKLVSNVRTCHVQC